MKRIQRRAFLGQAAVGAGVVLATGVVTPAQVREPMRRFTVDLVCGAIGVQPKDQRDAIRLAAQGGFESVQPNPGELLRTSSTQRGELLDYLRESRLVWGAAGMPVDFRKDDATFRQGMEDLPALAEALQQAGGTRMSTWLSPTHDRLTYLANFRQHVTRLRQVAAVLQDHHIRFGLEYVGPKTSWSKLQHPFIHTMAEAKELIQAINKPNVGLVLDSWHWYTAHETKEDLLSLTNDDIVACDLNDAPAGREVDEQIDSQRELPAATGVIDLKTFIGALLEIQYDGPVRAEPFSQALREMDNDAAIAATAAAMRKAVALVL